MDMFCMYLYNVQYMLKQINQTRISDDNSP